MALNGVHKWSLEGPRYAQSHHSRSQYGGSSWATREARPVDVFLALAVALVVIAVLCIAGLAIYLGAMRIDARSSDILLDGRLQVSGGAHSPGAPQLQTALLNSSSTAFQHAARYYSNLLERVYKRSELAPALRSVSVRGFNLRQANLVVFFRLQLDRRRTTTIEVEDVARGILVQEASALKPIAFTDTQVDAEHIVIKRHEDHQDDEESKNATETAAQGGAPGVLPARPPPPPPQPGPSTATLSTVTTRPLVLSTQHRGQPGGRRTTTTTTTSTTTSTTSAPPPTSSWEEATITFTGTGPPATEVSSRNRVGPQILAVDAEELTTLPPPPPTEPARLTSSRPSLPPPHPTGVVEPIAKEDVVVDPWNAPYGGAASRRPPAPVPPTKSQEEEEDAQSAWRPVRPTHQQHQQPVATGPAVPILLPTGGDDLLDEDVAVGVAEVVAIPSSALEGAVNVSPGGGALPVVLEDVPALPPSGPPAPLLDRLSLSPSEAFRQDILMERGGVNHTRQPVSAYAGDFGVPFVASVSAGVGVPPGAAVVGARPGDTVSKISLIVSGEEGEADPETSILQTGSGSIVIRDDGRGASTTSTSTTTTSTTTTTTTPAPAPPSTTPAPAPAPSPAPAPTAKLELAKAEMRNSNIRMPGLFALPDFPLLQQFPNLLGMKKAAAAEAVHHEEEAAEELVVQQQQQQQQQQATATTTTAPPPTTTTTTTKPAPAASEESVTIVTLLPVRSNSGLRRPLRRKPPVRPAAQPAPPPTLAATLPPPTPDVPPPTPASPPPTPSLPPPPPKTTTAEATPPPPTVQTRKQDDSAKILSSIKLVLESRQSHYTSTPASANSTAGDAVLQPQAAQAHVDRITHFIIPPERDVPAAAPAPPPAQRFNVGHIERVTTELPSPTASTPAASQAVKQQPASVTSRTPPHRGVPKGNKTSTQTRGAPANGTRRGPQKAPAKAPQRVPRPQQTSSRLKETVVRTNVNVGQAGAGRRAATAAQVARAPAANATARTPAVPAEQRVSMERVVTLAARKGQVPKVPGSVTVTTHQLADGPAPPAASSVTPEASAAATRQGKWLYGIEDGYTASAEADVDGVPYNPSRPSGVELVANTRPRRAAAGAPAAPAATPRTPSESDPGSVSANTPSRTNFDYEPIGA